MNYLVKVISFINNKTRLQIIRVYAQSVSRIHGHDDLDATPLADSGINDRLMKRHSLID